MTLTKVTKKSHITLYRIQNEYGQGPYRGNNINYYVSDWAEEVHDYPERPMPSDDGLRIFEDMICVFVSLDQLNNWFTKKHQKNLKKLGFVIYQTQIPKNTKRKFQIGNKQAIVSKKGLKWDKIV